jgi:SWI/SNF-related matrix-associated actin-dependent regulator 1 of chromatin subfamily A
LLKCLKATDVLKPYDTFRPFAFRYCNAFDGMWGFDASGFSNLTELNQRLRSTIMVRREKTAVLQQLPEKSYQIIPLEADKKCKEICANLSKLDIKQLEEKPELGSVGEIAKLRHELALSKLNDCITHIKDVLEDKQKIVVFAHHRYIIEKLSEELKKFCPVVFDGSTSMTDKNMAVESFQNDINCRVFIGQIQSAGVGITLTAADTVIFVESSWVPGEVEQAVDRCHRIGQKNHVLAQFLTVSGSVDEIMLLTIVKKKTVINRIMK